MNSLEVFANKDKGALSVTRLGGTTNLVFQIDDGAAHYVLRVPGKGTEEYINRAHEARAARETARVGVSPEVLHFDSGTGVMVTRLVDDAATMTPATFRTRALAPARASEKWS
ncbi:MAG: LPS biosynthesis choline kinase, partial [Steroidobacteraceae bacterium]